jgi:cytochrome c-type biogenesis protein CcmH/NrfG
MADKLQKDIEDTHVRTLETFVKNIQVKLVQRVAALETGMMQQAEAMHRLREYSQRTEDNLSRLLTGVDKLAQELPKRLQAPAETAPPEIGTAPAAPKKFRRKTSRARLPILIWAVVAAAVVAAAGYHFYQGGANAANAGGAAVAQGGSGAVKSGGKPPAIPAGTDTRTRMLAAEQYVERKEYSLAEDIYKQVLQSEPNNVDAMKALASVLYREDKIEESAAILDKLPRN